MGRHRNVRRSPEDSRGDVEFFPRRFVLAFFALYVVLGVGLMGVTPPFQSPDAFAHFDRSVQLAQGHLISTASAGSPGDVFPVGVYQTEVVFSGMAEAPAVRLAWSEFVYGWRQTWDSPKYFTTFTTGGNIPFLYLPQTLGVEIGRVAGGHILVSYYAAELMNFLAFVVLTGWAMLQFPRRLAFPFGVFLLLPMVTSLAISVNPDCLLIAFSSVFAAAWYRRHREVDQARGASDDGEMPRWWNIWSNRNELIGYAALFFMAMEKPPLLLLGLLLPLADRTLNLRRFVLRSAAATASVALAYVLWARVAAVPHVVSHRAAGIAPLHQLGLLVSNPVKGFDVLTTTLQQSGLLYTKEFLAGIGWLDTWFPSWFYRGVGAIVVIAAMSAVTVARRGAVRTYAALAVLALTAGGLLFTFYLVDTPYFNPTVIGFQGRYLLPLVPSLLVALGWRTPTPTHTLSLRQPLGLLVRDYGAITLVGLQAWIFTAYVVTVLHRYWP